MVRIRLWGALVAIMGGLLGAQTLRAELPFDRYSDEAAEQAIQKAIQYLLSAQNQDPTSQFYGSWNGQGRVFKPTSSRRRSSRPAPKPNPGAPVKKGPSLPVPTPRYAVGRTSLIVYALLEAGLSPHDKQVARALDWLCRQDDLSRDTKTEKIYALHKFRGLYPCYTYDLGLRACTAVPLPGPDGPLGALLLVGAGK